MVLNIKELGVLEPIIVWKDPETGLTCVVVGRQRVKHTLEANKLLLKEGKDPLLVPGVVKRGSANQMAKYMVSETKFADLIHRLAGLKKKCQTRSTAGSMRTTLQCCLAAAFRPFVQRCPSSMLLRPSGSGGVWHCYRYPGASAGTLPPEEQREKVKEIESATAGTTGHEKSQAPARRAWRN